MAQLIFKPPRYIFGLMHTINLEKLGVLRWGQLGCNEKHPPTERGGGWEHVFFFFWGGGNVIFLGGKRNKTEQCFCVCLFGGKTR